MKAVESTTEPEEESQKHLIGQGATPRADILDMEEQAAYVYDVQGNCQWVSPSGQRQLQQDAHQIIGRHLFDLFPARPQDQMEAWRRAMDSKDPSSFLALITVNSNVHRIQVGLFPVIDSNGQVQYLVGIGRRIVEAEAAAHTASPIDNARLYEEVRQALGTTGPTQEQLVHVERLRAMGELASGVAHEFNNALAAILGRTQLLMNQVIDETHLRSLHLIEQAARDSAQVVRRILDFARFDSEAEFSGVDLNQLVADVVELTRHKWSDEAQSKGQTIHVRRHPGDVPPALGNYAELREVLTNLVINACETISGDGEIGIATDGSPEHVHISVSDTGMGMSPEVKSRAFEPFFSTKGSRGTGLGLSVALSIISRHNGKIAVESEERVGTTVRISLPIAPFAAQPDEPATHYVSEPSKAADILVIEDDPLLRETMANILSLGGHKATLAADGAKGISLFKEGDYSLVFTDLGMPGMTGWQVVDAIRGTLKKCVNSQAVYPLSEQHGLEAQERR